MLARLVWQRLAVSSWSLRKRQHGPSSLPLEQPEADKKASAEGQTILQQTASVDSVFITSWLLNTLQCALPVGNTLNLFLTTTSCRLILLCWLDQDRGGVWSQIYPSGFGSSGNDDMFQTEEEGARTALRLGP